MKRKEMKFRAHFIVWMTKRNKFSIPLFEKLVEWNKL